MHLEGTSSPSKRLKAVGTVSASGHAWSMKLYEDLCWLVLGLDASCMLFAGDMSARPSHTSENNNRPCSWQRSGVYHLHETFVTALSWFQCRRYPPPSNWRAESGNAIQAPVINKRAERLVRHVQKESFFKKEGGIIPAARAESMARVSGPEEVQVPFRRCSSLEEVKGTVSRTMRT